MLGNLKKLRAEEQISQKALADSIGITQQSINKYENHNIEPDIDTLIAIADYFNVSIDYLVGRSDVASFISNKDENILSRDELKLISQYRTLCDEKKRIIKLIIESYMK